ncbi:DNA helicase rad5 [Ceratobasidium sp. 394]|nr:DNA helicase rad5 [Ceratobasidium sp. 394]
MCQEKEDALVCPVRRTPIKDNPPWGPTKDLNQDEAGSIDRGDNLVLASQKSTSNKDEFRSSTKIDALLRNLRELRENDPSLWAIVFSQVNKLPNLFALKIAQTKNLALQFTSFLDIIQKALARDGFESLRLDGTMSQQQRSRSLQTFKSPDPTPKIFCISLRAGGVGLNLTQAQHVFMMDFWWNRAVENQAIDRNRTNSHGTNPVYLLNKQLTLVLWIHQVYVKHFVVKETIEKRVLQIQKRKTAIVKGAFGQAGNKGMKESIQNMKLMFGD